MTAAVPFDWQVTDTYFVVAHIHYVLAGGTLFGVMAGFYYWAPKMYGFMLSERLGKWSFWLMFIGFNVGFFPMHISGLLGMARRVYTYPSGAGLELPNLISTIGVYVFAVGVCASAWNLVRSRAVGVPAGNNPWGAAGLEWLATSPPEHFNFAHIPIVTSREPLWDGGVRGRAVVRRGSSHAADVEPRRRARGADRDAGGQCLDARHLAGAARGGGGAARAVVRLGDRRRRRDAVQHGAVDVAHHHQGAGDRGMTAIETRSDHLLPPPPSPRSHVGWWGMVLFCMNEAALFACLIASYFYLGLNSRFWPPAGIEKPKLQMPLIMTALLVSSSIVLVYAERGVRDGAADPVSHRHRHHSAPGHGFSLRPAARVSREAQDDAPHRARLRVDLLHDHRAARHARGVRLARAALGAPPRPDAGRRSRGIRWRSRTRRSTGTSWTECGS